MDVAYSFHIEWLPAKEQHYHGPRKQMREILRRCAVADSQIYPPTQVIEHLLTTYPHLSRHIMKVKFYQINDNIDASVPLRFFILWCDYDAETRETLFAERENVVRSTGWYPLVTGHRAFHHSRTLTDFIDDGLRRAMNRTNIQHLPGLGTLLEVKNMSKGRGQCALVRTSMYDIVLDAAMADDDIRFDLLRPDKRKILLVSHSHGDHIGGIAQFVKDKSFVIALSPITLELLLRKIARRATLVDYLPSHFFYRLAPMWYRTEYRFVDGSSITPIPTYHFPGAMGFLFKFCDGKTLFYSGDFNPSCSYVSAKLRAGNERPIFDMGSKSIDYAILDGAIVGRDIGDSSGNSGEIMSAVATSLNAKRSHMIIANSYDYGLFIFLYLYDHLVSSRRIMNTRIFLDPVIIEQLEMFEWRMKRKRRGELDDAFVEFYKSRKTLAESVRIYDVTVNLKRNIEILRDMDIPVVIVLGDDALREMMTEQSNDMTYITSYGLDISSVGRHRASELLGNSFEPAKIVEFRGGLWLLHSTGLVLQDYLLNGPQKYDYVYLFHDYPKRLKRFIAELERAGYSGAIGVLPS